MTEHTASPAHKESFLNYLPEIYQDNPFLEGFLGLIQQLYEEMESAIERSDTLYDPENCPTHFLEWLGGWLGLENLSHWPAQRLRRLIVQAPALYRRRGTVEGLARLMSLYCDAQFFFVEGWHVRQYAGECPELAHLFGGRFDLWVLTLGDVDEGQLGVLNELLRRNVPAFAEAHLLVLGPSLVLGEYSFLGVNSVLSERQPGRLGDGSALYYTFLGGECG